MFNLHRKFKFKSRSTVALLILVVQLIDSIQSSSSNKLICGDKSGCRIQIHRQQIHRSVVAVTNHGRARRTSRQSSISPRQHQHQQENTIENSNNNQKSSSDLPTKIIDTNEYEVLNYAISRTTSKSIRTGCGLSGNSNNNRRGFNHNHNDACLSALSSGGSDDDKQTLSSADSKTIETAVFIDQALDNKFNGLSNGLVELNKLILTIMNQVQYLFRYSSLQTPITIKIVLVEHLRDIERQGKSVPNAARGDIDAYLSNFCNWQQTRLEQDQRLWWDHAILLSGLDLYKETPGRNHSGVLGLAWVGGMCKGNYSCTINEASNFESAFVIAHEIGHSLGIMHDGQKNRCDPNGFLMSERTGAGKVNWSRCSNNYLNESIKHGQLRCLDTERSGQIDSLFDLDKLRLPGQVYAINDQCKRAFGGNYSSFMTQQQPFNNVCRELWCVAGSWARAAHPALEGSSCGDQNRVCREGKCVR